MEVKKTGEVAKRGTFWMSGSWICIVCQFRSFMKCNANEVETLGGGDLLGHW